MILTFTEQIDWGASIHVSDLILSGDFHPAEIDTLAKDLIWHKKGWTALDSVPGDLTHDKWMDTMKVWPQQMTTFLPGFHLTLSKALITNDVTHDNLSGKALELKQKQLIQWLYAYKQWQTIINIMLSRSQTHSIFIGYVSSICVNMITISFSLSSGII